MKRSGSFCTIIISYIILLLFLVFAGKAGQVSDSPSTREYILKTIIYCLVIIVGYLISVKFLDYISKKYTTQQKKEMPKPKVNVGRKILLSLLFLFLMIIISLLFKKLFNANSIQKTKILPISISNVKQIYLLLPFVFLRNALIPAFFEEYYFREKLPGALCSVCKMPYTLALLFSSLLFCSAHTGGIYHALFAFLSAVVLSILFNYTGTLKYPVIVHFTYNCITIITLMI